MNRHLVTIEVSIVCCTHEWVNTNSRSLNKYWLECLNRQSVQSRRTVQHHWMTFSHFSKNVPYLSRLTVDHLLSRTNSVAVAEFLKSTDDEWLEESECHFLRKTTLTKLKLRTNHDHRTTRVVNTLTKKVLTETSTLTFKHI